MTAINIFFQRQRGVIVTDSLMISFQTGLPVLLMDKCVPVDGTKMAVAARGDWRVPSGIAENLTPFYANIDQLIADEGRAISDVYDLWLESNEEGVYFADVQLMVVGWSDSLNQPRGAVVCLTGGKWNFSEIDPEKGMAAPLLNAHEMDRLNKLGVEPGEHWNCESCDPEMHLIPYMEAQRRMRLPLPNNPKITAHIVGGHILLTEITEKGVEQRVIHEWPDAIGEPVRPAAFLKPAPVPIAPPPGMSRQQRRAWERQHGKVAA